MFDENIYLCVRRSRHDHFHCKKFSAFLKADQFYSGKYDTKNISDSTIVSVSRLAPTFIHPYILYWKLSKQFIKIK